MTPGPQETHSRAGALQRAMGTGLYGCGPRKNQAFLCDLLPLLERTAPAPQGWHISVGVENAKRHKAKADEPWWATHPRWTLLGLPTNGPRAHPSARACGAGHDKGTRNPKRQH
jgi:hypothetical protein